MEESDRFAIYVHHGGHLTELDGLTFYMKGDYLGVYDLSRKIFNIEKLNDVIKSIGYEKWSKLWFRYPKTHNFVEIKGQSEVKELLGSLGENVSIISVYVEDVVDDESGRFNKNMTLDRDGEHVVVDDIDGVDGVVTQMGDEREYDDGGEMRDDGGQNGDERESDDSENEMFFDDNFFGEGDEEYEAAKINSTETSDEELTRLLSEFAHPCVEEEDEPTSNYVDSDGNFDSEETDEENEVDRRNRHKIVYDPKCDHSNLQLVVGMRFQDGWECKRALTTMSIETGRFVQFRKVSKTLCVSKCIPPCPWKIHASVVKRNESFCIKTYGGDHKCLVHSSNKLLTSK